MKQASFYTGAGFIIDCWWKIIIISKGNSFFERLSLFLGEKIQSSNMRKKLIAAIALFIIFKTSNAQFGLYASAAYINSNGINSFYNNTAPGPGQDIGSTTFQGTDLGPFEQNSSKLKITGAEVKTYKGISDNVCSATLNYTVYLIGARPASPVYTSILLGFYSDCFAPACGSFFGSYNLVAGGGCCSAGDQKWQSPGNGSPADIDLTTFIPGTYTLEMYYSFTGEDGGNGCSTTKYDNNNNNPSNYTATFTITQPIPVSFGNISLSNHDTYNTIYWNTYSEALTNIFKLEHATNGIDFYTIAEIPAAGYSSTLRSYALRDNNPKKGLNYYRIKMLEADGKYQYSAIIKTTHNLKNDWYVISNAESKSLQVYGIEKGDEISIFSPVAAKVFSEKSNSNHININTTNIAAGIYFIKLKNSNSSTVKQVFIGR